MRKEAIYNADVKATGKKIVNLPLSAIYCLVSHFLLVCIRIQTGRKRTRRILGAANKSRNEHEVMEVGGGIVVNRIGDRSNIVPVNKQDILPIDHEAIEDLDEMVRN